MTIRATKLTPIQAKKKPATAAKTTKVTKAKRAVKGRTASRAAAGGLTTPTPMQQLQSNWCWAACAQMIANADLFNGQLNVPQQEQMVTTVFGSVVNQPLDQNGIVNLYTQQFAQLAGRNIQCQYLAGAIPESDLQLQLTTRNRPVQMGITFGTGKHVSIIAGITADGQYVVFDPTYGRGEFTYDGLRLSYGVGGNTGSWTDSFGGFA